MFWWDFYDYFKVYPAVFKALQRSSLVILDKQITTHWIYWAGDHEEREQSRYAFFYYLHSISIQICSIQNYIILPSFLQTCSTIRAQYQSRSPAAQIIMRYRQYSIQIMLIKTKSSQESTLKQAQRQHHSHLNRHNKSKEMKQVRKRAHPAPPQANSIASISSKRLHKPSRSTIQPNEHLHYNSPISAYHQNQNIQSNAFSFTHILQQNLKNQQSHINIETSLPPPVTSFQLNQPKTISIALTNRHSKERITKNDQQSLKNHSMSKQNVSIQRDSSFPYRHSIEKSLSKSPLRLVNPNKISNTPKLKQYKKGEQERSFKNLLQNKQSQTIRLQCSQKIFKFMDSLQNKSLNKRDIVNCSKSKSNLLSTGFINLSQRLDHDKLPSDLNKTSKGNISSQAQSSSNQIKQFFQEDSSSFGEAIHQNEVHQLKQKVIKAKNQIETLSKKELFEDFQNLINETFNPQIDQQNKLIQKLTTFKKFIIETVESIVQNTSKISKNFVRDIDEYIKIIEASFKTKIDWMSIEQKMEQYDKLQSIQCQNEILMERIKHIQQILPEFNAQHHKLENNLPQKQKIQAQLSDICAKISKINHHNDKMSLKWNHRKEFYADFFETVSQQLQKLRLTINESEDYCKLSDFN